MSFFPKKSKLPYGVSMWRKYPLSRIFPSLFSNSSTWQATVADNFIGRTAAGCSWFLVLSNNLNLEDKQKLADLQCLLQGFEPKGDTDYLVWNDGEVVFTVRSCYLKILDVRLKFFNEGVFRYDWESVWETKTPSKVSFLLWLIAQDRVLTHSIVQKKGFRLASMCELCYNEVEDTNHLFCKCAVSSRVWEYFSQTVNQSVPLSTDFGDRLLNERAAKHM